MPNRLSEILDRRLEGLTGGALAVTTALGVADRGLPEPVLVEVAGLERERLMAALHELADRHLLSIDVTPDAQLRHPLLAEAARRRLVPGEAAHTHSRLAHVLGAQAEANAAEVAEHWKEAAEPERELEWRATAARQAHARTAPRAEAAHWLRALELAKAAHTGDAFDLVGARLGAFDALELSGQLDSALRVAREALLGVDELDDLVAAEVLRRAAEAERLVSDDVPLALVLADRAIDRLEPHGATSCLAHALGVRANSLIDLGRSEDSLASLRRALDVSDALDDKSLFFEISASLAWQTAHLGDLEGALDLIRVARERAPDSLDPRREAEMATMHTDALIQHRRPVEEVMQAAARALEVGREWGLDFHVLTLRQGQPGRGPPQQRTDPRGCRSTGRPACFRELRRLARAVDGVAGGHRGRRAGQRHRDDDG